MYKFSKIAFNFSLCFSLLFTALITAQEIEEVVVTATKQEKSVQDIRRFRSTHKLRGRRDAGHP